MSPSPLCLPIPLNMDFRSPVAPTFQISKTIRHVLDDGNPRDTDMNPMIQIKCSCHQSCCQRTTHTPRSITTPIVWHEAGHNDPHWTVFDRCSAQCCNGSMRDSPASNVRCNTFVPVIHRVSNLVSSAAQDYPPNHSAAVLNAWCISIGNG